MYYYKTRQRKILYNFNYTHGEAGLAIAEKYIWYHLSFDAVLLSYCYKLPQT